MKYITAHCHSTQHTHTHLGWLHSVRKMLLFYWPPVDGDIFILLYCYCCWRPITQGLSYKQKSGKVSSGRKSDGPVGKSVLLCVCTSAYVHMQRCVSVSKCRVFPRELIIVATTLGPAGQVWQTATVFRPTGTCYISCLIIHYSPEAAWTVVWNHCTVQCVITVSVPQDPKQTRVGVDPCFPCTCLIEYSPKPCQRQCTEGQGEWSGQWP